MRVRVTFESDERIPVVVMLFDDYPNGLTVETSWEFEVVVLTKFKKTGRV